MSAATTTRYTCDLCCHKSPEITDSALPPEWIKLCFEEPMQDRMFFDRHICGKCVAEVKRVTVPKMA